MIRKVIIQNVVWSSLTALLLFGVAGTWRWPQAWIYTAIMIGSGVATGLWLAQHDPDLLAERLKPPIQQGQPRGDKIFMSILMVLWMSWLIFMALDAERFGLSQVPIWAQVVGAALILVAMYAFFVTFRENSFAAPVVKIQKERGQTVVSTGPYSYVRHPMYAGASLLFVGTPLLLGSAWGLAFAPLWIALLAFRIPIEERALRDQLAGYNEYAARVRYRLVPGVW
jgi:protein-S-isoprenylcysteine O-methyltransferase Ste14